MSATTEDPRIRLECLATKLFARQRQGQQTTISQDDDSHTVLLVQKMMDVVKAHPDTALKASWYPAEGKRKMLPIQALIRAGVSLEKIVEFAALNPQMVDQQLDKGNMSLLHYACLTLNRLSIPAEDIMLLARQWPEQVGFESGGWYPLCTALKERQAELPLTVVMELFQMFPAVIEPTCRRIDPYSIYYYEDDRSAIPTAIRAGCPMEVIRFLFEQIPKNRTMFYLPEDRRYPWTASCIMDVGVSMEICKLLPQLEKLILKAGNWTIEPLKLLLQNVRSNKSIVYLELTLPYERIFQDEELLGLLASLSQENNIQKIMLTKFEPVPDDPHAPAPPVIEHRGFSQLLRAAALSGVPNLAMEEITLPDEQWLVDFLLSDIAPRKLRLDYPHCLGNGLGRHPPQDTSVSKLEHLTIICPKTATSESMSFLLSQLSKLPFLKVLYLETFASPLAPDVSTSLDGFVREAPRLRSLTLDGFVVDHKKLCLALEANRRLEVLVISYPNMKTDRTPDEFYVDLLKHHNISLKTLNQTQMENPAIMYYLRLNRAGRHLLRDPWTGRAQFIWMLCTRAPAPAPVYDSFGYDFGRDKGLELLEQHNLLYGMLRESPGIWCGPATAVTPPPTTQQWSTISNGNAVTPNHTSFMWWTANGKGNEVLGHLSLQRFSNQSPLFRIRYQGREAPAGDAVAGVLHLPIAKARIKRSRHHSGMQKMLHMNFLPNSDSLESIEILMPTTNEADDNAATVFGDALVDADQERASA